MKFTGRVLSVSEREYHEDPTFSYSAATRLLQSPAHCRAYLDGKYEATPSMIFGSALHMRILDETAYLKHYQVKLDGRTNHGKAQLTEVGREYLLTQEQFDTIERLAASLDIRPALSYHLDRAGSREMSVFWVDPTGVECKARIDAYAGNGDGKPAVVIDLKTTRDASPRGFKAAVMRYRYDLQIAHYMDGVKAAGLPCDSHLLIALQSEPPMACGYVLPDHVLDIAREELTRLKVLWAECQRTGKWPGYEELSDLWFGEFDLKRLRGEYGEAASGGGGDTEPDSNGDYAFA